MESDFLISAEPGLFFVYFHPFSHCNDKYRTILDYITVP